MTRYRERLWPTFWMLAAGLLLIPSVILVFAPINMVVGVILAVALYAGYVGFLVASSPVIEVTDAQLRVGSARIPLLFTGATERFETKESARQAAGPGLDARAWICLRGWVPTSVRVEITDVHDPIPYWLFSTRNPAEVATAIREAQVSAARAKS